LAFPLTAQVPIETAVTYRLIKFRPITLAVLSVLTLAGAAMLVNFLMGGEGPPALFVFLWLGALGWNAYGFLFRIAYEIGVVDGSILRWRSIAATHDVPLPLVRGITTFLLTGRRVIIDGHRSPLLVPSAGFDDVVAMLVQFRPDLVIQNGWYDRMARRFSRGSFYWRRV
jgi:hypothetical protein